MHHNGIGMDGEETEEIDDLRMIKRGTNFPPSKRRAKKKMTKMKTTDAKISSFKRHRTADSCMAKPAD